MPELWDLQTIRKTAWDTTFRRGWRAWLALVAVCFTFAFIGVDNATQTSFVDTIDQATGASDAMLPHNMKILDAYLDSVPFIKDLPIRDSEIVVNIADSLSKYATWVIRLLALNPRYFKANPGEVWVNVIIVALISIFVRFVVQNVLILGQDRYVMETRFSDKVTMHRAFAPFHLHGILHLVWVMLCYHVTLLLWSLTIVGGFYKVFQYLMVPYLLAENPNLTWREAKRLSAQMTNGYKWKMFVAKLSYIYITLLRLIPLLGILVSVPLSEELDAEFYFVLRTRPDLDRSFFIEHAFDGPAFVTLTEEEQLAANPQYLLQNLDFGTVRPQRGPLPYPVIDLIYFFFAFCFVGWVWEVGLHFVQAHEFVNRGTLYGPWIPIYGVGGVGIIALLDRFKANAARLFALAVGLCAVLEYITSWVLDFMFDSSYWSYEGMLFNVNGRICLAGLLAFGFGGLLAVYVAAPAISSRVEKLPERVRYAGAAALVGAFLCDIGYCLINGFNGGSGVGEKL